MQIAYRYDEVHRVSTALGGTVDIILKCPDKRTALGGKTRVGNQLYRSPLALGCGG